MNELIEKIFEDFGINGEAIPVKFMRYEGHGEPYVTYQQIDYENSLSADDELIGYVEYYDFDIYSKGNYTKIIDEIKKILFGNLVGLALICTRLRQATITRH